MLVIYLICSIIYVSNQLLCSPGLLCTYQAGLQDAIVHMPPRETHRDLCCPSSNFGKWMRVI